VPGKTSYQFKEGASVTIKAEPNPGYKFDQWDDAGADNTSATRTIVLGTNDTIFKASFKEADKVKIEVAVASGQADRGTVSLPDGKTVGDFPIGSSLTLTAKPNPGFAFEKWDDDNTDPVRTITVTKAQTFIASFSEAPETKVYPVTVAGVQLTAAKNSLVAGSDLDGILLAGSIIYNEASASLILNNVNLELDSKDAGILIDGGTDNSNVTVIVVGKCLISVTDTGLSLKNASNITLSGEGDLTILAKEGIVLDKANLTVQMLTLTVNADTGISGSGTETLTVSAAKVSVTGLASGSIINIASLVAQYCSMDADHTFNTSKKWVEITDSKTPATDEVTFTPLPMLEVKPMEAGTGHFELSNGKTKFTDIGWFEAGTEVSIKAIPASGFVFSHWTDNINWKDPDDFVPADKHDVITMPAKDKTYDNFAVFYYKSKSTATWYGVNGNDFISFKLNDFGATVKTASGPDAGDVKVGDYVQNSWVVLNNTTVQAIPFSRLDDGQDLKEPRDLGTTSEDFTDMAYDLLGGKIYAVAGTKLYTIHERTGNVEEVAEFQYKEAAKNVEAIAVNAKRNLYLLSSDDGGVLYTAAISKIKDGKVPMSIVGDEANAGKVGVPVEAGKEQSIAFDHTTGELFWGAKDYIRNINLKTAKATVAADLEQQEGKQGFVKALHNMAKPVIVSVEVADGQDGWGTATIDDDDSKKVISGTTFTITAKANSGYYFSHWEIEGESGVVSDERNYDTSVSEATTFVAYFAEGEGISTITFDPTKKAQKVLVNGIIYILRDGKIYSILGNAVQ